MKKTLLVILSLLMVLLAVCSCAKKQSQESFKRANKIRNELNKSITSGIDGNIRLGRLEELDTELGNLSEKLATAGENLGEEEINAINSEITKIETDIQAIVSGEKSEADLLMDKYARVANLYSSIASEFAGTPVVTNGSFSTIGFKITDIATMISKEGETLPAEKLEEILKTLDEAEHKLLEISGKK